MPISDVANIVISLQTAQAIAAGFGIPLVLGAHTHNTDRVRFYSSTDGMVSDGFANTEPEYKFVASMLSQNPSPASICVGRRANRPTMRWAITPVAVSNATYSLKVNGTQVNYTAGASPTVSSINLGLKALIDALTLAVTTSDQTTYLRVLANAAGAYFTVEVLDTSLLGIAQDNVDAGVAADLDAIKLVDSSWYAILSPYKSLAENQAIAVWTEAQIKLFLCESQDSAIITAAAAGATDIAAVVATAKYARTSCWYHQGDGTNLAASLAGACLPLTPGSETWKFKQLAGVTPTKLTDTHIVNLKAKNCNWYYTLAGLNTTAEGWVASGDWVDTIRGRDWFVADTGAAMLTAFMNLPKVPYTDHGATVLQGVLISQLDKAVSAGLFSDNPKPTTTVPRVSAQSTSNRQARFFPNLNFTAQLAGAIHKVGVNGTVTA
jgi:hypothetical protein